MVWRPLPCRHRVATSPERPAVPIVSRVSVASVSRSPGRTAGRLGHITRLVVVTSIMLMGCGGGGSEQPTGDVSGKITVAGKPLTEGSVAFQNTETGRSGASKIAADGTYSIPDLLVGKYKVLILPPPMPPPMLDQKAPPPDRSGFPMNYRTEAMSDLTAEVVEGANTGVDFDLKL